MDFETQYQVLSIHRGWQANYQDIQKQEPCLQQAAQYKIGNTVERALKSKPHRHIDSILCVYVVKKILRLFCRFLDSKPSRQNCYQNSSLNPNLYFVHGTLYNYPYVVLATQYYSFPYNFFPTSSYLSPAVHCGFWDQFAIF